MLKYYVISYDKGFSFLDKQFKSIESAEDYINELWEDEKAFAPLVIGSPFSTYHLYSVSYQKDINPCGIVMHESTQKNFIRSYSYIAL